MTFPASQLGTRSGSGPGRLWAKALPALSAASGVCVVSYWMVSSTRLNPTLSFHPWKKLLEPQCQFLLELPSEVLEPRRYVLGTPPQGCPSSESIHNASAPSSAVDLLLVARSVWAGTLTESLPKAQLGRGERKAWLGVRVTRVKLEGHGWWQVMMWCQGWWRQLTNTHWESTVHPEKFNFFHVSVHLSSTRTLWGRYYLRWAN